jgi:thiaminase
MQELERSFLALAKSLEESEPDRAARLVKAFEESKTLLVEPRMQQIVDLLDGAQLDTAGQEQQQVVDDIRKLVAILLAEDADRAKDQEEIDRLKEWHKQISMLIKDQQQQQNESQKLDKKDDALDRLAKQIAAVEELIRREQELIAQTARTTAEGVSGLDKLADRQETIRQDTEFVAKEVAQAQAGGQPSSAAAEGQTQAGNNAQPSQSPPSGGQPAPGQKPLEQSAQHQQRAAENLQAAQGKTAQQDEQQALQELQKALAELKKEQDRLQKPPEDTFDNLAKQQDATANKTSSLSDQVSKAGQSASKAGAAASSACSSCLGGACQSMAQASQSLQKKSPGSASSAQQKAGEELKKAQEEVEKRLEELGEKMDDEVIERLEDIFREMLGRQQQATAQTVQLDAELQAEKDEDLRRADRITIRRLVQEEQELAGMADHALQLIEEDGTTISFPVVVENMRDNLNQVATMIEQQQTGPPTQTLQHEIERTLEELIEALQIAKKQGSGSGQGQGGNCKPALLPNTAELKLLRALQLRVNRRTKAFDGDRPEGALDDVQTGEITRLSTLQRDISDMVLAIIERTQLAAGLPDGIIPLLADPPDSN